LWIGDGTPSPGDVPIDRNYQNAHTSGGGLPQRYKTSAAIDGHLRAILEALASCV
jgi:hypothetical protein